MIPYFYIAGVKFATFPLVIFLAIVVCAIFYFKSRIFSKTYNASVCQMCLPIFASAALGSRILSAITLSIVNNRALCHYLIYGGSVFYGGVLGGLLGLLVTCKIKRLIFFDFADVFATILPLGHAIARIGCFLNGCCYGRENNGFLSVSYPVNGVMTRVLPTWFIETFFCMLLFFGLILWCRRRISGLQTSTYLIVYSIYRFIIEFARGDEVRGLFGVFSTSQYISIMLMFSGIAMLLISSHNNMPNYMFNNEGYIKFETKN